MSAIKEAMIMLEEFDLATQGWDLESDGMSRRVQIGEETHQIEVRKVISELCYIWTVFEPLKFPNEVYYGQSLQTILLCLAQNGMKDYISDDGKALIKP